MEVEFSIHDLAQSEITSDRRLKGPKGPNPLRIVRGVAQYSKDSWPLDIERYNLPRRGEIISQSDPDQAYYYRLSEQL
jgi:hypothetical protein